jgi:serine/threonine protein kinase
LQSELSAVKTPSSAAERTRYELLGTIASGGMGRVYFGRARADGGTEAQPVAVKILHPHLAFEPDAVAMFLDEARLATRIDHPNVVRVRDIDVVGDELVIVMEYIEGIALSGLLRLARQTGVLLPIPVVLRIMIDALRGLHAAHELRADDGAPMRIVHRDVSPHNVLVGADGVARVTDFGVAFSAGRLAQTRTDGGVRGKLQYLAPEQIHRRPPERRVDVWAAGAVLWECISAKRLFSGSTEAETIAQILRAPVSPPSGLRADAPLSLDEMCLRALEREPERRFVTAAAFADALETGVGVAAARPEEVARFVNQAVGDVIRARREALAQAKPMATGWPSRFSPVPPSEDSGAGRFTGVRRLVTVAAASLLCGVLIARVATVPQHRAARDLAGVAASASAAASALAAEVSAGSDHEAAPLSGPISVAPAPVEILDRDGVTLELPDTSGTKNAHRGSTDLVRRTPRPNARDGTSKPALSQRRFMPADL